MGEVSSSVDLEKMNTLMSLWASSIVINNDLISKNSTLLTANNDSILFKDVPAVSGYADSVISFSLVSASALLLSMYKDDMLFRVGSDLSLSIDDQRFKSMLGTIMRVTKKKTYIGDIEFTNHLEAFNFIRNKLLHGEYKLVDDSILLTKDEKNGLVSLERFSDLTLKLEEIMESKSKSITRTMILPKKGDNRSLYSRIKEDKLDLVEIEINKKGKRKVDTNDMIFIDDYVKKIQQYISLYHCDIDEADNIFKTEEPGNYNHIMGNLINRGITFKYEKKNIKEHSSYEQAKSSFLSKNNHFINDLKNCNDKYDFIFLQMLCDRLEDEETIGKNLTSKAFKNYIRVLKSNLKNPKVDVTNLLDDRYFSYKADLLTISRFINFYGKYHYGLDNIYSNRSTTNLRELLSGNKFDFSEMDLSLFDDPHMTLDISLTDFSEQAISINKDYLDSISSLSKVEKQYNNIKDNSKVPIDIKELVEKNYLLAKDLNESNKQMVDKLNSFDLATFERKINIIDHIRNAFAHGNVIVLPYDEGDILSDRKIFIKDIHNGVTTYERVVTYDDFEKLFSHDNNEKIVNFIAESYDDKTKTVMKTGKLVLDENDIMLPEKFAEWDQLQTKYENEKNEKELSYMNCALATMAYIEGFLLLGGNTEVSPDDLLNFISANVDNSFINEESLSRIVYYINSYYKGVPDEFKETKDWLTVEVDNKNSKKGKRSKK